MKKNIVFIMVLLLMFTITLTGCGGGTDEPVSNSDATVEKEADVTISKEDLIAKYNECSVLFNEVDGALVKNGTYDTDADVKAQMDTIYDLLDKAEVVVQSDLSEEEIVSVHHELQTYVDQMSEIKAAHM